VTRTLEQPSDKQAPCPFCHIATGQSADPVILRTEHRLAFSPRGPIHPGHSLIVPIQHITNLYSLPDELARPILLMAKRLALAIKQTFAAEGVNLRQNNEPAGGHCAAADLLKSGQFFGFGVIVRLAGWCGRRQLYRGRLNSTVAI
jgi:galactose-1-phosphate uridylyltransferase